MILIRYIGCFVLALLLSSCTDEVTLQYSSFEWLFFSKEEAETSQWAKMIVQGRYIFGIVGKQIFVREKLGDEFRTHLLDDSGKVIDTLSGESMHFDSLGIMEYGKRLNDSLIDRIVQIPLKDSTVISHMVLADKLIKLDLLGRETVREKRIDLVYMGEKRTVFIPDDMAYFFYDIKQYDDTRFILSFKGQIQEVSKKYMFYVGMIDFKRILNQD